jgi:hypothetical protein
MHRVRGVDHTVTAGTGAALENVARWRRRRRWTWKLPISCFDTPRSG